MLTKKNISSIMKERNQVSNMTSYGKPRIPLEVISFFKDGQIYPLRFRYYHVEKARYLIVFVQRVDYLVTVEQNGLMEKTFYVQGKNQKRIKRYALYLDPKSKNWFLH